MESVSEQDLSLVLQALRQFTEEYPEKSPVPMETITELVEEKVGELRPWRTSSGEVEISERQLGRVVGASNAIDWSRGSLKYELYPEAREATIRLASEYGSQNQQPEMVTVPATELEQLIERYWRLSQETPGHEPFAYDASELLNERLLRQTE